MTGFYLYSSAFLIFSTIVFVYHAVNQMKPDGFVQFLSIASLVTLFVQISLMFSTHWS